MKVKLISVGRVYFADDKEWVLIFSYETDTSLDNDDALRNEVRAIWKDFRKDVEKAGLRHAIVSANTPKKSRWGLFKENHSHNYVFAKQANGDWLISAE